MCRSLPVGRYPVQLYEYSSTLGSGQHRPGQRGGRGDPRYGLKAWPVSVLRSTDRRKKRKDKDNSCAAGS